MDEISGEEGTVMRYAKLKLPDFVGFPKIGRYSRPCIVTEKIDGTNGQIWIPEEGTPESAYLTTLNAPFYVGSRKRWITPDGDNAGFARWCYDNATELLTLGTGHHFGEWWGKGIQRNYGAPDKRFSLFNVMRWTNGPMPLPACCRIVPVLWYGAFDQLDMREIMTTLNETGSIAEPGYMKPEGIVIHHPQTGHSFKKTYEKDGEGKGL